MSACVCHVHVRLLQACLPASVTYTYGCHKRVCLRLSRTHTAATGVSACVCHVHIRLPRACLPASVTYTYGCHGRACLRLSRTHTAATGVPAMSACGCLTGSPFGCVTEALHLLLGIYVRRATSWHTPKLPPPAACSGRGRISRCARGGDPRGATAPGIDNCAGALAWLFGPPQHDCLCAANAVDLVWRMHFLCVYAWRQGVPCKRHAAMDCSNNS